MNKIDLIIDALESAHHTNDTGVMGLTKLRHDVALAAARELRELKPVAYMGSAGLGYDKNKYLSISLYALGDEK